MNTNHLLNEWTTGRVRSYLNVVNNDSLRLKQEAKLRFIDPFEGRFEVFLAITVFTGG